MLCCIKTLCDHCLGDVRASINYIYLYLCAFISCPSYVRNKCLLCFVGRDGVIQYARQNMNPSASIEYGDIV